MKLITWNVNGLRACLKKGFMEYFSGSGADIFSLQETKMQPEQAEVNTPGYTQFWNSAEKKGYSGTAVFSKGNPLPAVLDMGPSEHAGEGRMITLEYEGFYLVNVYTPNAKEGLARISYRQQWEDAFRDHVTALDRKKPVIVCGDMNVARTAIDLKNPKPNEGNAGYSQQERDKLELLLAAGFTDSFRHLYPEKTGAYTWWSYRFNARKNNAGWRIDYFLVSHRIADKPQDCVLRSDIEGSDHCPVELTIDL